MQNLYNKKIMNLIIVYYPNIQYVNNRNFISIVDFNYPWIDHEIMKIYSGSTVF